MGRRVPVVSDRSGELGDLSSNPTARVADFSSLVSVNWERKDYVIIDVSSIPQF